MKIYIVCSVRNASPELQARLEAYTDWLEEQGHEVHLPHRDTDQDASGFDICNQNGTAIALAEEIHILYDKTSQGSHFDLGMIFAYDVLLGYKKRIRVINFKDHTEKLKPGKSFPRMLEEWTTEQNQHAKLYPCVDQSTELDFSIPFENF